MSYLNWDRNLYRSCGPMMSSTNSTPMMCGLQLQLQLCWQVKPALPPDTTWYDVCTRHIMCGVWLTALIELSKLSEMSCCLVAFLSECYSRPRKKTIDQRNHSLSLRREQHYMQHACSISSDNLVFVRGCDLRPRQLSLSSPYMVGIISYCAFWLYSRLLATTVGLHGL